MDEAFIKKILPHSMEAEQSVIGSMIMDKDAITLASEIISSSDFYDHSLAYCLTPCWNYLMKENR